MSTDSAAPAADTLEALRQRHRKEQRDLVSRITQKKKQATKKTRKGVNDECERLEQELKERQAEDVRALTGEGADDVEDAESESEDAKNEVVDIKIESLRINGPAAPSTPSPRAPSAANTDADTDTDPRAIPAKKKNRQKDRLARRKADQDAAIAAAEAEALNAPDPRALEQTAFAPLLAQRGLALHEIRADGHCMYAAIADQLRGRDVSLEPRVRTPFDEPPAAPALALPYKRVRYAAAGFIEANRGQFEAFLEDPLEEHVRRIRETGEWGGHLELLALARSYGVRICVLHSDGRVDRIEDESEKEKEKEEIWLGYYRHSHGLGEHYNSLRRAKTEA